jgi:hypothetical protein
MVIINFPATGIVFGNIAVVVFFYAEAHGDY